LGLAVSIVLISAPTAKSQSRTGSIVGTVTDTSGAVVPGTTVRVTNVRTGEVVTEMTGNVGEYVALNLLYGEYKVTAEKPGFKTAMRPGLTLQIGQTLKMDLTLEPGAVTQNVQVTGAAPLLDTQSSDESQVIRACSH